MAEAIDQGPDQKLAGVLIDLLRRYRGGDEVTVDELAKFLAKPKNHRRWFLDLSSDQIQKLVGDTKTPPITIEGAKRLMKALGTDETQELLLEPLGTVIIPTTIGKFVAKEKFVRDTGRKAKVKISYISDNFDAWFLSGSGKTEDPISEQTLRYHKLRQSSVDGPIIAELGGVEKSETTLSEMFSLMEKQGGGEKGVLLKNGYANIFYIKDQNGVLRTVDVGWGGGGWHVGADSVELPRGWGGGRQVFSRNSVLESSEPLAPAQA